MKKIKLILIVLCLLSKGGFAGSTAPGCYYSALINSTQIGFVATGRTVTTACDLLSVGDYTWAVYTWSSTNASDNSYFAWQYTWGTVATLVLDDTHAQDPDVALVSQAGVIYAVVSSKNSNTGNAQYEVYKWNGSAFTLYTSSTTITVLMGSGLVVTTAIHVSGNKNGHVVINFDNGNLIYYTCGDIDYPASGSPLKIDFGNAYSVTGAAFPAHGPTVAYPDVSVGVIEHFGERPGSSIVCFSEEEYDGTNYYITGLGWPFSELYDVSTHVNKNTSGVGSGAYVSNGTISPYDQGFLDQVASSTNTIGKTAISITERHGSDYKYQPQVAWYETDNSGNQYIKSAMAYWDGYLTTSTVIANDLTNYGPIPDDLNSNPAIASSMSYDYTVVAWDYQENVTNCLSNTREPITVQMRYSTSVYTASYVLYSNYYLGVGEPALGSGSSCPGDRLNAISVAAAQSVEALYFFYDLDDGYVYSKHAVPNSTFALKIADDKKSELNLLSPNPVSSNVKLNLPDERSAYNLSLFDLSGKVVFKLFGNNKQLDSQLSEQIITLNSGTYLLKVENGSFDKKQLIIK